MPYGSSLRATRPWSIAVVMAIIAAVTFGVWYWQKIVQQRLPDWTWSKAGARLVPDRVPETVEPFAPFDGDLIAVNKGPGPSNQIIVRRFLSRDNKLGADDEQGGTYFNVLDPGERSYHFTQPITISLAGKPPGLYYAILVLDPLNQIAETDEGNNAIALRFERVVQAYNPRPQHCVPGQISRLHSFTRANARRACATRGSWRARETRRAPRD